MLDRCVYFTLLVTPHYFQLVFYHNLNDFFFDHVVEHVMISFILTFRSRFRTNTAVRVVDSVDYFNLIDKAAKEMCERLFDTVLRSNSSCSTAGVCVLVMQN